MKTFLEIFRAWTWRMAWRDSRRERPRLLVFSLSIVFGIAALVGVGSLNRNLGDAVNTQAKDLLGADLMLSSGRPFLDEHSSDSPDLDPAAGNLIGSIFADRALEVSFSTMILFGEDGGTRLVDVRATDPQYPFYGTVETAPADAWERFQKGEGILLDGALAAQFGIAPGEIATIGALEIPVLGSLTSSPPQAGRFSAFAPQVFLPRSLVEKTGLTGARSLASYRAYFRDPTLAPDQEMLRDDQEGLLKASGLRVETVADRKRNLGKTLDRLTSFFSLTGFIALLLGGVGIASAVHVHISGRLPTVATLRCLGCPPARATAVFLAQGIVLGAIGSLAGAALGIALQQGVVGFFKDDFPFPISAPLVPVPVLTGMVTGFLICIAFTLLPLLQIRRISPLAALRGSAANSRISWRDPARALVLAAIVIALTVLAVTLSPPGSRRLGIGFIVALGLVIGLLALTAAAVMKIVRMIVRPSQPYIFRQGLAGLYRPKNQTTLFLLSTGLGTCLILTLFFTQGLIVSQLASKTLDGKADTFLVDVQPDQRSGIAKIFTDLDLPLVEEVPIVPMRLTAVKGVPVTELQKNPATKIPGWTLRRDFRTTFRSGLVPTEFVVRGDWVPSFDPTTDPDAPIPISIEEVIARELGIDLGDQFTMRVGGIPMELQVANIRNVDWDGLDLNFFIVFPEGSVDDAPGFNVISTRTTTDEDTGKLNRAILKQFPNITVFDASQVVETLQKIVGQVGKIIRFTALFTILTGIMILVGTVLSGKRDRIAESVLLRTLGASKSQIWKILASEYALLGLLASTTGALLALATSWALATYVFEIDFLTQAWPAAIAIAAVTLFTTAVGLVLSRGITSKPPLTILRGDA